MFRWGDNGRENREGLTELFEEVSEETGLNYDEEIGRRHLGPKRNSLADIEIEDNSAVVWLENYNAPLSSVDAEGVVDYEKEFWFENFDELPVDQSTKTAILGFSSEDDVDQDYHLFMDAVANRISADMNLYSSEDDTIYAWAFNMED